MNAPHSNRRPLLALVATMILFTLTSLKAKLRSLRPSKKEKRKSAVPVHPSPDTQAEKVPAAAPALVISLPPPINVQPEARRYERKMGDSELSYYLPSRANGVNDMYVTPFLAPRRPPRAHFLHSGIFISVSKRRTTP